MTLGFSVKTYHLQNGRVATNDEGQAAKTLDAVSDSYRQLFVKVFGTALESEMIDVRVDRQKKQKNIASALGSSDRVAVIFTRMWCPSGDFPEYNKVAKVRRTEA